MRFRITQQVSEGIRLLHLHDDEMQATVSIAPDQGAMLHAFEAPINGSTYNIINNYTDIGDIDRNLSLSYKSSKLSPFACRIRDARYSWEGKQYEFEKKFIDGSAIHGLLFNKNFSEDGKQVTDFMASASFSYEYKAEDPGYPFHYRCRVTYTLLPGLTLQVQTSLQNKGEEKIPISDGWHPYFQLNAPVDDCFLQFPSGGMVEFDSHLVPTRQVLPFDTFNEPKAIGDTMLDNCFLLDPEGGQPACVFSSPDRKARIEFTTDGQYPYLQLYIPGDRKSIAIENLSSAPDSFNNRMGLVTLDPGEEKAFTLHYTIKTEETV
ncbi:aldose 1-epimerase [Flavihumibacter solisilvae]|uniref:Aldose epimerase n=1 Tax=Flavihumibacter solisilvae TaxID=1349421 RepID=A0A0C1LHC7_9BACT|nr:aldose 1-epimerase [Flavihumibacter solisilvae]KIC94718.1 hypothetical protein OI18_09525 [Flavihumibacter solisilvae]